MNIPLATAEPILEPLRLGEVAFTCAEVREETRVMIAKTKT